MNSRDKLRTALAFYKGALPEREGEDDFTKYWRRRRTEDLLATVASNLEGFFAEYEHMRAGLCVIANKCSDYAGHDMDRDKVRDEIIYLFETMPEKEKEDV